MTFSCICFVSEKNVSISEGLALNKGVLCDIFNVSKIIKWKYYSVIKPQTVYTCYGHWALCLQNGTCKIFQNFFMKKNTSIYNLMHLSVFISVNEC